MVSPLALRTISVLMQFEVPVGLGDEEAKAYVLDGLSVSAALMNNLHQISFVSMIADLGKTIKLERLQ